ncbi:gluconate 2-dehydrogenase subunit 3 family protein [Robertmurraya yapensis]|uniref:Gluconate 2-dehydrogenase subunit 3 family protein n=2 Tax=Bacillaceae TaxID=186817 RepID=A0A431W3F7_9BACI|nr:gluconate 2-dehydrogenase subunit 3 family protein [Bacillus yapensis]RTR29968.1 gluconate 2-dehydrogenase subunit 3 family protein [Bacillus yapensis]TKS95049.1 twin-arginine translocation signal domain-containing protein [Bacillus yapensis]
MAENANQQEKNESLTRRRFLKNSGIAIGGLAVGGALGSLIPFKDKTDKDGVKTEQKAENYNLALMFFTQQQFRMVEAATERIFPADDNGPGAKDLGVAYFIDHQLSGDWGFNAREYMQPPFFKGEKVQGYQGRLRRREIFDIGLRELQNHSLKKFEKNFIDLDEEQQIEVLTDFAEDKVQLTTISPSGFFNMMRTATLEGAYSDPLYSGNRNMDGWKMRNYPGSQMAYTDVIDQEFKVIAPKSLKDHLGH